MKKFHFLIVLSLIAGMVCAQDNSYLLYSFKGNVSVVENKIESKAKIGKVMNSAATLKLGNGSMATLICNEVAMFTIKKSGSYSMAQFSDSCKVSSSSMTAKTTAANNNAYSTPVAKSPSVANRRV